MEYEYQSMVDDFSELVITSIDDEEGEYEESEDAYEENNDYLSEFCYSYEEEEYSYLSKEEFPLPDHFGTYFVEDNDSPPACCLICGKEGHSTWKCLDIEDGNSEEEVFKYRSSKFCVICEKEGHLVRECFFYNEPPKEVKRGKKDRLTYSYNLRKEAKREKKGCSTQECRLYNKPRKEVNREKGQPKKKYRPYNEPLKEINLAKKSRQKARRSDEKLLSNHIGTVDWETIGKVNGLGKQKETIQTPKKFIKEELNKVDVVRQGKDRKNKWLERRNHISRKFGSY